MKCDIAIEDLKNYTICVKTKTGIRNMRRTEDIEDNLVWINQATVFPPQEPDNIIRAGTYVRYININVSPKVEKGVIFC